MSKRRPEVQTWLLVTMKKIKQEKNDELILW